MGCLGTFFGFILLAGGGVFTFFCFMDGALWLTIAGVAVALIGLCLMLSSLCELDDSWLFALVAVVLYSIVISLIQIPSGVWKTVGIIALFSVGGCLLIALVV